MGLGEADAYFQRQGAVSSRRGDRAIAFIRALRCFDITQFDMLLEKEQG